MQLARGKVKMNYVLLWKKNKKVEEKILAKKKKNENEICPDTAANKDHTGCNNFYTQSEKSQNQTTENGEKRDNKKSAWK